MEVVRHCKQGESVILIGHKGHPEVEGTMGQYQSNFNGDAEILLVETPDDVRNLVVKNPEKLAYVTQTTLSMDDTAEVIRTLREKFPKIMGPKKDDICYATQNRQDAVKHLADDCDLILVVGSPNSSNSNRLRELAEKRGKRAYLIDGADDIDPEWLGKKDVIGVTAGASAPEVLVEDVVERLRTLGADEVIDRHGTQENVVFVLPKNLRKLSEKKTAAV
jgi:4-hydroxy-3-methylbut-2-enyl diphosphate reductase